MSETEGFPWEEDLAVLVDATADVIRRLWALGFREAAVGLLESSMDVPFAAAADYAETRAGWLVKESDGVTRERIQRVIAETLGPQLSDPSVSGQTLAAAIEAEFTDMADWRARTIAATETAYAAAAGQVNAFHEGGVEEVLISDGDDFDEPCIEADGATWTLAEYEANPLEHPNCLPGDVLVAAPNVRAAFARWYEGDLIVVKTAAGHELSATPNHPVLTRRGWLAIGELDEGDYVVRALDAQRVANLVDPDHDGVPAPIAEIAKALRVISAVMPATAEDFHGDVTDGDVYVVLADGPLDRRVQATLREPPRELEHVGADVLREASLAAAGSPLEVLVGALHAADGRVGLLAESSAESRIPLVPEAARLADRSQGVTALAERPTQGGPVQTEAGGDLVRGLAGAVVLDEVVQVERRVFAGHVYNLETSQGWYLADSIVTHNCSRAAIPIIPVPTEVAA